MGRKTLSVINLVIVMIGIVFIVLSQDLWMVGVGLFLCVFGGKNGVYMSLIIMT